LERRTIGVNGARLASPTRRGKALRRTRKGSRRRRRSIGHDGQIETGVVKSNKVMDLRFAPQAGDKSRWKGGR
jgi:hypothetical protein